MSATLYLIEARHKQTGRLLFATHGMIPAEAGWTASYLSTHLPMYKMVVRDRYTNEFIEEFPQNERTD